MEKLRRIIDFEKLNKEIVRQINHSFPEGFETEIKVFKNHKGDCIRALEMETDQSILLIKITPQTESFIEENLEGIEKSPFH